MALVLRLASSATANLSYFALASYALAGRAQAIQALALSWLFTMISPGIAPEASLASVGRYAVLAGAAASVLLRSRWDAGPRGFQINRVVLLTLVLGAGFIVHSLLFSPMQDVSILKAVSWTVAFSTLLSAWSGLAPEARQRLERQLFGALVVLMLVSLPLLATELGFLRNGTGFQGVLNHPQAFGPVMALLAAWLGSRILAEPRPPWRLVGLFGMALALIVLSETRTAGLGLVLGTGLAVLAGRVLARRRLRNFLPGLRSGRVRAMIGLMLIGLLLAGPMLGSKLAEYVTKRSDSNSLAEAYERSRGGKIEEMWTNIRAHPLRGIGFGIASDPYEMEVSRDPVLGLPTGAAVEKGVVLLAVWEELGLPGLLAVLAWLWLLLRRSARNGGFAALAVCLTALFMNFGESVLFSPGGFGMLPLILIAWAATARPEQMRTAHA